MKKYHEDSEGSVIIGEDNLPTPSYVCICSAYNPDECSCGAWDVDIELWNEEYGEDS